MAWKKVLLEGDAVSLTSNLPAVIGSDLAVGSGTAGARDDHVHKIPQNFVTTGLLVNRIITATQISTGTITGNEISSGVISNAHMAASAIDPENINSNGTTFTFGQIILTPTASGSGTSPGTVYYDSDDSHPYVYQA